MFNTYPWFQPKHFHWNFIIQWKCFGWNQGYVLNGIYSVLDGRLVDLLKSPNPWDMCTSVGVDNTSVNIAVRDSLKTRVLKRNLAISFNGCACHILHNAAQRAAGFTGACWFDVEELVVNLFYWFDKSTRRKNELQSYCTFCDQEYRAIIKHVSTCWLSLVLAIERSLKQFPSLKSYFLSENEPQDRFKRLQRHFNDPICEVYIRGGVGGCNPPFVFIYTCKYTVYYSRISC